MISNFFGKPLLRYPMHDVIQFTSLEDAETGIKLPQMQFVGRSGDFIDLGGFTGLLDENLKKMNTFYADYENLIEDRPLVVTTLNRGAYSKYMAGMHYRRAQEAQRSGATLLHGLSRNDDGVEFRLLHDVREFQSGHHAPVE